MKKSLQYKIRLFFILFFGNTLFLNAQADTAPSITADGRQLFCVGSTINVVTDFSITDPDDTGLNNFLFKFQKDINPMLIC